MPENCSGHHSSRDQLNQLVATVAAVRHSWRASSAQQICRAGAHRFEASCVCFVFKKQIKIKICSEYLGDGPRHNVFATRLHQVLRLSGRVSRPRQEQHHALQKVCLLAIARHVRAMQMMLHHHVLIGTGLRLLCSTVAFFLPSAVAQLANILHGSRSCAKPASQAPTTTTITYDGRAALTFNPV